MHDFWIYIITFAASLLTLLTGFGLGTILTPVFALVFDIKVAVLLVAIVHFLNNLFKFSLFRRHVNSAILKRFGIVSIAGAFLGAMLQTYLYTSSLKVFLGLVLIFLGVAELNIKGMSFKFPRKVDILGGLFSGLLGGLIGNQGAIRSAYLLNYGISKEEFIATATVIALVIDATRIPIYLTNQFHVFENIPLKMVIVIGVAFLGTLLGKKLLKRFSLSMFKKIVALFVVVMGLLFVIGLL